MTAYERTGWRDRALEERHAVWGERLSARDMALSARHRKWGKDVPVQDIDWLVIEYDSAAPVALIDYQRAISSRPKERRDPSIEAFARLGEAAAVPAFVVRYRYRPWEFCVSPLEDQASGLLPDRRRLREIDYVRWIYRLRGREVPAEVVLRIAEDY